MKLLHSGVVASGNPLQGEWSWLGSRVSMAPIAVLCTNYSCVNKMSYVSMKASSGERESVQRPSELSDVWYFWTILSSSGTIGRACVLLSLLSCRHPVEQPPAC